MDYMTPPEPSTTTDILSIEDKDLTLLRPIHISNKDNNDHHKEFATLPSLKKRCRELFELTNKPKQPERKKFCYNDDYDNLTHQQWHRARPEFLTVAPRPEPLVFFGNQSPNRFAFLDLLVGFPGCISFSFREQQPGILEPIAIADLVKCKEQLCKHTMLAPISISLLSSSLRYLLSTRSLRDAVIRERVPIKVHTPSAPIVREFIDISKDLSEKATAKAPTTKKAPSKKPTPKPKISKKKKKQSSSKGRNRFEELCMSDKYWLSSDKKYFVMKVDPAYEKYPNYSDSASSMFVKTLVESKCIGFTTDQCDRRVLVVKISECGKKYLERGYKKKALRTFRNNLKQVFNAITLPEYSYDTVASNELAQKCFSNQQPQEVIELDD